MYRIERLDPTPGEWTSSPLNNALRHTAPEISEHVVAHGAWLAQAGLPLPRMTGETALIYSFSASDV